MNQRSFFMTALALLAAIPALFAEAFGVRGAFEGRDASNNAFSPEPKPAEHVATYGSLTPGIGSTQELVRGLAGGLNWQGATSTFKRMLGGTQTSHPGGVSFA